MAIGPSPWRMAWLIGIALLGAATPVASQTQNLTLAWDANTEPDVAGYKVYAGLSSRVYTLPTQSVPAAQTTYVFAATPGVLYYFAVKAVSTSGVESPFSAEVNAAIPVVTPFTDDPLVAGVTVMRAVHINELRTRINNLRTANGLPVVVWTDAAIASTVKIRAVHVSEMRSALNAVYAARALSLPTYSDPTVAAGTTTIKAVHITELRARIVAVE